MKLFIWFCVLLISPVVLSLDEDSAKELRCMVDPPIVKYLDLNWAKSWKKWYTPAVSELNLLRIAAEAKGCPIYDIRADELYYDSCLTLQFGQFGRDPRGVALYGFNGKKAELEITKLYEYVFKVNKKYATTTGRTSYISLTDNKSYVLYITCWDDDEAGWNLQSPFDTLDYETLEYIKTYLKSLGFNEKYFTRLSYKNCGDESYKCDLPTEKYLPEATSIYESAKRSSKSRSTDYFRSRYPAGPYLAPYWNPAPDQVDRKK